MSMLMNVFALVLALVFGSPEQPKAQIQPFLLPPSSVFAAEPIQIHPKFIQGATKYAHEADLPAGPVAAPTIDRGEPQDTPQNAPVSQDPVILPEEAVTYPDEDSGQRAPSYCFEPGLALKDLDGRDRMRETCNYYGVRWVNFQ